MTAFGIMLAAAGVIVLIAGAAQAAQNRSYAACSETVMGTVTRKQSRHVKHGKSHELTLSYIVNGIPYEKVVGALLTEYNVIAAGDEIELHYKPGNPKKAVRPRELKPRNARIVLIVGAVLMMAGVVLCFIGRSPSPDNAQIEAAIRASLSREASPPQLDFDGMEVPMRSSGSASAVLWTADGKIQRNYTITYHKKIRTFAVASVTTSQRDTGGIYYPVPNDPSLVLTELAPCFDFSDDFSQEYLLLYAGEGKDLAALRTVFERDALSAMTAEQLAGFEVCDLGGSTLILLVPRYMGLSVWINEIEHQGDMMLQGAEVSRFESGQPVYIYCDFSDKLPAHEIHVSFDGLGHFFTTRESLLTSIKP